MRIIQLSDFGRQSLMAKNKDVFWSFAVKRSSIVRYAVDANFQQTQMILRFIRSDSFEFVYLVY